MTLRRAPAGCRDSLLFFAAFCFLGAAALLPAEEQAPPQEPPAEVAGKAASADAKNLDVLRYGTETEIIALVDSLKLEKNAKYDDELAQIAEKTNNTKVLVSLLKFFGETEKSGLENKALSMLKDFVGIEAARRTLALEAAGYLGKLKSKAALPSLKGILDAASDGDTANAAMVNASIRAYAGIGASLGNAEADDAADYLRSWYESRSPAGETQVILVAAMGETKSKKVTEFITGLIANESERFPVRTAALDAVSKIADPDAKQAVIAALNSADANVRSAAVSALGSFSGDDVDAAILDGLKDTFYRTRLTAASSAGKRKLAAAVPYLRYRALYDDAPAVRDEAVKALAAIGNKEAVDTLGALFGDEKSSDRLRALCAKVLVETDRASWEGKVNAALAAAKSKKQTALAKGFEAALKP
jgi:HEAT repeat protein